MKAKVIRSVAGLLAEVISVFLPVLVIWLGARQYHIEVSSSPEWSVGSIILFGQACVNFTTSIASLKSSKGPMSLIIVLLVTGIVVSCYLLVRATEIEQSRTPCTLCGAQQVTWFFVAALIYVGIGLLSDLGLAERV
jgi:uncharacterized membrane protein